MNFISSNIKFLRNVAGLSQTELAEKVNLNRGNITSYERGIATPGIETLQRMSKFFGIELVDLINKNLAVDYHTTEKSYAKQQGKYIDPTHLSALFDTSILNTVRQLSAHQYTSQQQFMQHIAEIADQLERIANSLEQLVKQKKNKK